MTTIAWDGKTLAGDTQTRIFRARKAKLHRLPDGSLFGACGYTEHAVAALQWLQNGGDKPKLGDGFHALWIRAFGGFSVLEEGLIAIEYDMPFYAVGSGRDFAMAAMRCGKTAREAVLIAHEFDPDTGDEVQELTIP